MIFLGNPIYDFLRRLRLSAFAGAAVYARFPWLSLPLLPPLGFTNRPLLSGIGGGGWE